MKKKYNFNSIDYVDYVSIIKTPLKRINLNKVCSILSDFSKNYVDDELLLTFNNERKRNRKITTKNM